MDTQELLRQVRRIEIKTKGLSQHLFSGEYHSAFKGRGMSFSEVRSYQFGDDVRNIDWNVTARTNEAYVKVFEEERELTVMLLIDVSASSLFGTSEKSKKAIITELAAIIAFSAIQNNDKVGVLFFSDKVERYIAPQKGKKHILMIIRELIEMKPERKGTQLKEALKYFNNVIKKRSICFIISDFDSPEYENDLRIAKRKHDVVGIHVYDQTEREMPNIGLLKSKDPESGEAIWIDTSNSKFRQEYERAFKERKERQESQFLKMGASWVDIPTEKPYIQTLLNFFKKRAR